MGEIIFSLLIEPDVDKVSTMKAEDDREGEGEKNKPHVSLVLDESEFLSFGVESNTAQ